MWHKYYPQWVEQNVRFVSRSSFVQLSDTAPVIDPDRFRSDQAAAYDEDDKDADPFTR